jgi:hypothetical protein
MDAMEVDSKVQIDSVNQYIKKFHDDGTLSYRINEVDLESNLTDEEEKIIKEKLIPFVESHQILFTTKDLPNISDAYMWNSDNWINQLDLDTSQCIKYTIITTHNYVSHGIFSASLREVYRHLIVALPNEVKNFPKIYVSTRFLASNKNTTSHIGFTTILIPNKITGMKRNLATAF